MQARTLVAGQHRFSAFRVTRIQPGVHIVSLVLVMILIQAHAHTEEAELCLGKAHHLWAQVPQDEVIVSAPSNQLVAPLCQVGPQRRRVCTDLQRQ